MCDGGPLNLLGRSCRMWSFSCLRRSLDSLVRQRYSSHDRKPKRMSVSPPITMAAISPPPGPVCLPFDELLDENVDDVGLLEDPMTTKESVESARVLEVALAEKVKVESVESVGVPELELEVASGAKATAESVESVGVPELELEVASTATATAKSEESNRLFEVPLLEKVEAAANDADFACTASSSATVVSTV